MEKQLQDTIEESLKDLRFGSVEITVHEGRITQIERRERFRAHQETLGNQIQVSKQPNNKRNQHESNS